jgi:hypothetical protein
MGDVHRRLAYLLAWAVAAAITVGISWLGIRSVLAAAAPTQTVPLSAIQLRGTSGQIPPNGANPSSIATPTGGASSGASGSWSQDGQGFKRTFHTVGGDVDFFAVQNSVQVESNTPKPGYTANVTRYGPDSVMVSFFGDRKVSRVWVRWWNGPYAEVTESVD